MILTGTESMAQRYMLVSSRGNHTIKRYNLDTGAYVDDLIPATSGLNNPQEVLLGPDGNLYVSFRFGSNSGTVKKYDLDGSFLGDFTSGYTLAEATKMSWTPSGDLTVSQWSSTQNEAVTFDGQTGQFQGLAAREGGIVNPMDHEWLPDGRLIVANWSQTGQSGFIGTYDSEGLAGPRLTSIPQGPVNMWWDDNGDLLVADWTLGAVQRYTSEGQFRSTFISGLNRLEGYAVYGDYLYLGEWQGNTVKKYRKDTGEFVETFITAGRGGLLNPNSILILDMSVTDTEDDTQLPGSTELSSGYPNPFSEEVTLQFTVAQPGPLTIVLFDILGREVMRTALGHTAAGNHSARLATGDLAPGAYVARLVSANGTAHTLITKQR